MYVPTDRDAPSDNAALEMARGVRDVVMANAEASEAQRTLNKETVEALWSSGLMV